MALPDLQSLGPDIDDYAVSPGVHSCQGPQSGVQVFRQMVLDELGGNAVNWHPLWGNGIARDCSVGAPSDHHEGRAWDWAIDANSEEDLETAGKLFDWLFATDEWGNENANLRRAGITYMIFHLRPPDWASPEPGATGWGWNTRSRVWKPYYHSPHADHVHISFGWPAAHEETSLYQFLKGELEEPGGDGDGVVPLLGKSPANLMLALGVGAVAATAIYLTVRRFA